MITIAKEKANRIYIKAGGIESLGINLKYSEISKINQDAPRTEKKVLIPSSDSTAYLQYDQVRIDFQIYLNIQLIN